MVLETLTPLFLPGALGPPELAIILLIFVLLFGANKIPELARSTGEAMGEFQKGREEVERELQEMQESTPDIEEEAGMMGDAETTTESASDSTTTDSS